MTEFGAIDGYVNRDAEWLTYETLFNMPVFRRTNQQRDLGIVRMPTQHASILLSQFLPPHALEELAAAFFPETTPERLEGLASRPWVAGHDENAVTLRKRIKRWVLLPFNFVDNGDGPRAIGRGTRGAAVDGIERLARTWPMWHTASRSNVVRLAPAAPVLPWSTVAGGMPGDLNPDLDENSPLATTLTFDWPRTSPAVRGRGEVTGGTHLRSTDLSGCYSVKCGVEYVGAQQQGPLKGTLEDDSVLAFLRGEWVATLDRRAGRDPLTSNPLVQRELLTVTQALPGTPPFGGDGFQLRDLSGLRRDARYLPAFSVPYLATGPDGKLDVTTLRPRLAAGHDYDWCSYWSEHLARPLGIVKADLLLRYALQPSTPNVQNFLLELDGRTLAPTGRVVFRDLGDAWLHTDVVWAWYGNGALPATGLHGVDFGPAPGAADDDDARLRRMLTWEMTTFGRLHNETGGTHVRDLSSYPRGTQLNWYRYTSISKGGSVAVIPAMGGNPEARAPGWQDNLHNDAFWGLDHTQAYVSRLEGALGLKFGVDLMRNRPDPREFLTLGDTEAGYARAGTLHREFIVWERDAVAGRVQAVLTSPAGQAALRQHHTDRR